MVRAVPTPCPERMTGRVVVPSILLVIAECLAVLSSTLAKSRAACDLDCVAEGGGVGCSLLTEEARKEVTKSKKAIVTGGILTSMLNQLPLSKEFVLYRLLRCR